MLWFGTSPHGLGFILLLNLSVLPLLHSLAAMSLATSDVQNSPYKILVTYGYARGFIKSSKQDKRETVILFNFQLNYNKHALV